MRMMRTSPQTLVHPLARGAGARERVGMARAPLRVVDPPAEAARPVRGGLVDRPHLLRRLAAARGGLAVLVAPAGYGKTTLLRQWEAADPRPFTWVAPREASRLRAPAPGT